MAWYFIVLIVIASLLVFIILFLFIAVYIAIYFTISKKGLKKVQKKFADDTNSPFYQLADIPFINDNSKVINTYSFDGFRLAARLIKGNSHKYFIFSHGWGGDPYCKSKMWKELNNELGLNLVIVSHRASNDSEGKYATLGIYEGRDILSWIEYISSFDKEAIFCLFGESMGASSLMVTLGLMKNEHKQVKCAILDSGYSSLYAPLDIMLKKAYCFKGILLGIARIELKWITKVDIKKMSPCLYLNDNVTPIMLIHGTNDEMVPFTELKINEEHIQKGVYKEVYVYENANHVLSMYKDYDLYKKRLVNFINKFMK